MRIVHVATRDRRGGAARAVSRVHEGLLRIGCDSTLFVAERYGNDPSVVAIGEPRDPAVRAARRERARRIEADFARHAASRPAGLARFSDDRSPFGEELVAHLPPADVVHLHWVADFLDHGVLPRLAHTLPLVWTFHDLVGRTGGCHYDEGCRAWRTGCGRCPQLGSDDPEDLSRAVFRRKEAAFRGVADGGMDLVALGRGQADALRASPLLERFPLHVVPEPVDARRFAPRDRDRARAALGLDPRARIVAFVATSQGYQRKGLASLLGALAHLRDLEDLLLVTAGFGGPAAAPPVNHVNLGHVADDGRLADLYAAADLVAAPSFQDAFLLVAAEAMACGTPVVAWGGPSAPEAVRDGTTGVTVPPGDEAAMARAIRDLLSDPARLRRLGAGGRRRVLDAYDVPVVARRYRQVYRAAAERFALRRASHSARSTASMSGSSARRS